jgi:hypothetical protein
MSKIQITLDDYNFINGTLNVLFILDNKKFIGDDICESLFEEYVELSGKLEFYDDRWNSYNESHYTYDYKKDYSDWRDESCEKSDILDFLYYYYKRNKIPEHIEE